MRSRVLAYLLPAACLLYAQQPAPLETNDLCRIEGRVVDSVTGEPVRDVDLTLTAAPAGADTLKVGSDAGGRFCFDDVEPGSYILFADRRGFPREVYSAHSTGSAGTILTLATSPDHKEIEFKLASPGVISGTVVDGAGAPTSRVIVTAIATGGSPTGFAAHHPSVATNGAGEFRFPSLAPGNYLLMAVPPEDQAAPPAPTSAGKPEKAEERLLVTYYPSAADMVGAATLKVGPGQELSGMTITLQKGCLFQVRGTVVTSSPDVTLADVNLQLMPRSPTSIATATSSALNRQAPRSGSTARALAPDGTFDLGNVRPGSYYLAAVLRGNVGMKIVVSRQSDISNAEVNGLVLLGRIPVDVADADVTGIVLHVGQPLQVTGTLKMEGQDEPDFTGVQIQLRLLDSRVGNLSRSTVSAENTFTLKDASRATHAIIVSGLRDAAYVKSIRLGSQEPISSGLDLTNMEAVPPLEILISPNGATVEGTADQDDDKPAPGAWVALIPDPARPESIARVKSSSTDLRGKFRFSGVPPGEYRLYAFAEPQPSALADWDFFKPFESNAVKLSIREGERKQVDLTVLRTTDAK